MATIPASQESVSHLVARADGVVAGLPVDRRSCWMPWRPGSGRARWRSTLLVADGARVVRGDHLATLRGATRTTLVAERTVLNVLSRTSGVATHTRRWADVLDGSGAMVLDTRKTTPGMRALEKYAVRCGGGTNKRMGLYDVAMIKDNHKLAAGGLTAAYDAVRRTFPDVADPGRGDDDGRGARVGGRRGAVPVVRQHVSRPAARHRGCRARAPASGSRSRRRAT